MKARYTTNCPVCQNTIKVGEQMGRTNNRWAHYNCARHEDRSKSLKLRCER